MSKQQISQAAADVSAPTGRALPLRTAALVAGDAVSFLVFSAVGRDSHNEATGFGALGAVIGTALPFALGWFVVSPFLGAFRRPATSTPAKMLRRTELAWLCAWPVAMLARLAIDAHHQIPMPFPIIVLAFNALFLGLWRGAFALLESRRA